MKPIHVAGLAALGLAVFFLVASQSARTPAIRRRDRKDASLMWNVANLFGV